MGGSNCYMFKFDLKNGYHHIDILNPAPRDLRFSWEINAQVRCFILAVLPFDLISSPVIFTKVLRHSVKFQKTHSIKITILR